MNVVKRLIVSTLLLLIATTVPAAKRPIDNEAFHHWLKTVIYPKARRAGITDDTLRLLDNLKLNEELIIKDRKQSEFVLTFWEYYSRVLTDERIRKGQEMLKKYQPLLEKVTAETGVPGRYLVAFWGAETNYGGFTGNTPILQALATLAYEGRRERFFTQELLAALKILQDNHFPPEKMKGSWAGAMGQVQFMPSNYLNHGRDGDGDGRVDLWDSMHDAFLSAAHFLKHLGWQPKQNWGREVILPDNFDYTLADGRTKRTLAEWARLGVKKTYNRPLPTNSDMKAALYVPQGKEGPAFLLYPNFYVIKKWNHSYFYATSVGRLADRIAGLPPLAAKKPDPLEPLPRERVKNIQRFLAKQGYRIGRIDGIFGMRSRAALRQWQKRHGMVADGFPSAEVWEKIQQVQELADAANDTVIPDP